MPLKEVTPTDTRQNLYQYVKDVNTKGPIEIKGRTKLQSAVLMSEKDYQHLKKMEIKFEASPHDILYQKLNLLDDIQSNLTFYSIGQGAISMSFRQVSPINTDPMWPMSTALIGCISCYALRANGEQLDQHNLQRLGKKSLPELIKFAKLNSPKDKESKSLYDDVIMDCRLSLSAMAGSDRTKEAMMNIYRLSIV